VRITTEIFKGRFRPGKWWLSGTSESCYWCGSICCRLFLHLQQREGLGGLGIE
jgi:hypothetical protein